jgi:hypothetical protein
MGYQTKSKLWGIMRPIMGKIKITPEGQVTLTFPEPIPPGEYDIIILIREDEPQSLKKRRCFEYHGKIVNPCEDIRREDISDDGR